VATPRDRESFSRRTLLTLAAAATAALRAVGARLRVAAAALGGGGSSWPPRGGSALRRVYYLEPEWGAGEPGCPPTPGGAHQASHGCHACAACHRHAAHKLWADEASVRFAHPHCRCEIGSRLVAVSTYRRMFGVPGTPWFRGEFDDRWA